MSYPGYQGGTTGGQFPPPPNPQGYPPHNGQQGYYSGYPPQQGQPPYPPHQGASPGGYPTGPQGYGVPPGPYPSSTYPPAPAGYPAPQAPAGYPPQPAGYPPSTYSPAPAGYPAPHAPAGYPPSSYPPAPHGYPAPQAPYGQPPAPGGYYGNASYPPVPQGYGPPAPYGHTAAVSNYPPPQQQQGHYGANSAANNNAPLPPNEVQKDMLIIRNALAGLGTDERALISVVSRRTPQQMEQISQTYHQAYGKSLWKAIDDDVSGDFQNLLEALIKPSADFEAHQLYKAMEGAGTNEKILIEILVGKANAQITTLKQRYQMIYGRPLESEMRGELSGDLKRFFTAVLSANRDELSQNNDPNMDAEALYKAGPGKIGTDEKTYIHILTSRSYPHLFRVSQAYKSKYGKDIEHHIKKEFSGFIEDALVSTMQYACNPSAYAAELFESSMRGLGTNDSKLCRLVSRYFHHVYPPYPDLRKDIVQAYASRYGRGLQQAIESETSGDFRKLLVAILQNTR